MSKQKFISSLIFVFGLLFLGLALYVLPNSDTFECAPPIDGNSVVTHYSSNSLVSWKVDALTDSVITIFGEKSAIPWLLFVFYIGMSTLTGPLRGLVVSLTLLFLFGKDGILFSSIAFLPLVFALAARLNEKTFGRNIETLQFLLVSLLCVIGSRQYSLFLLFPLLVATSHLKNISLILFLIVNVLIVSFTSGSSSPLFSYPDYAHVISGEVFGARSRIGSDVSFPFISKDWLYGLPFFVASLLCLLSLYLLAQRYRKSPIFKYVLVCLLLALVEMLPSLSGI